MIKKINLNRKSFSIKVNLIDEDAENLVKYVMHLQNDGKIQYDSGGKNGEAADKRNKNRTVATSMVIAELIKMGINADKEYDKAGKKKGDAPQNEDDVATFFDSSRVVAI